MYGNVSDDPVFLRFFENRLTQEIGNDISCGKCTSSLYENNATSQFFFQFELFAQEGCPYDILSKRVRILAIKEKINLEFTYRNEDFHAKLTFLSEDLDATSGFNLFAQKTFAFCNHELKTNETIFLFCPAIMVSSTEVYELGINNVLGHTQFQKICVDDYFSVKRFNSAMAVTYCGTFCISLMTLMVFGSL
jgi:hypothetical protein